MSFYLFIFLSLSLSLSLKNTYVQKGFQNMPKDKYLKYSYFYIVKYKAEEVYLNID